MAPLTKDSTEVTNPVAEAAVQVGAPAKPAAAGGAHLRADAISLEVPVKVHGSRVTEVARGVAPHTEPFEEETSTMIVFPQGAVLRMSTAVSASQMLVVTNLKTRQDAICRVLKVRTFSNMQGYVEVEFTHKQAGYWGAIFAGESPAVAPNAAAPVPAIPAVAPAIPAGSAVNTSALPSVAPVAASLPTVAPQTIAPPASVPVASTPQSAPVAPAPVIAPPPAFVPPAAGFVAPVKPEPTFAQIGTQEEVQPAASATSPAAVKFVAPVRPVAATPVAPTVTTPTPLPTERAVEKSVSETPKLSAAAQALAEAHIEIAGEPVAPPATLSLTDLRGDEQVAAVEEKDEESAAAGSLSGSTHGTFGSFSGGAALGGSRAASAEIFGERLDGNLEASSGQASEPRGNSWMLIAACVGVLFVGVFGGVFYFRTHSSAPANSAAAKPNTPALPQPLAFQSPSEVSAPPAQGSAVTRNSAAHPVTIVTQGGAPAAKVNAAAEASGLGPRVVTPEKPASNITADMVQQQLVEHPVATQRSDAGQTDAAPSLDPASSSDSSNAGALNGIVSSTVPTLAAPEIRPEGMVRCDSAEM